jgi:hypothetical protein
MPSNPTVALGDTLGLWRDKINLTIAEVNSHVGSSGGAHADVTTTVAGFMSAADKTKLNGVADNANNYTHPATHPASIIVETTTKRFVTDAEKGIWNRAVLKDSETGAALLPVGTEAQRPGTPSNGLIRYNTELNSFEGYSNGVWGAIGGGGGATGGGVEPNKDDIFYENSQTIQHDYTLTTNKNAMTTGPVVINDTATVIIPDGSRWVIL